MAALADAGFDLVHRFDAHAAAREPGLACLAASSDQLGLLIGNTRALWPRFLDALQDPELASAPDPVDRYTERTLAGIFGAAAIYYGHREYASEPPGEYASEPPGEQGPSGCERAFLPLQRLAAVTGLGALAPSQLVVHPIYGPWFALRAVVVLPGIPVAHEPIAKPCECGAPCSQALRAALSTPERWRAWLAVRDACSLRAWRYGEDQIHYHYTKTWLPES